MLRVRIPGHLNGALHTGTSGIHLGWSGTTADTKVCPVRSKNTTHSLVKIGRSQKKQVGLMQSVQAAGWSRGRSGWT